MDNPGQGWGSEFVVFLPVLPSPVARKPSAPTDPEKRAVHAGRVLVVDDNVDSAEMLAELLGISGYDVCAAYTGPAALEMAAAHPPDVVLLDIGLPGINGYDVARRLRQIPHLGKVRIVAMTGYGQESDLRLAREAGFDSHLTKPVDVATVRNLLGKLMARPRHVGVPVTGEVNTIDQDGAARPEGPDPCNRWRSEQEDPECNRRHAASPRGSMAEVSRRSLSQGS